MTPHQMDLVRRSFALVAQNRVKAGQVFYDRLFTIAPEVRPMFAGDMNVQAAKLIDTLALCVGQLRYADMLAATLRSLGERHAGYGVRPEHYETVGETLLWTLETTLGPTECRPEVKEAWAALYGVAAGAMQDAAAQRGAA